MQCTRRPTQAAVSDEHEVRSFNLICSRLPYPAILSHPYAKHSRFHPLGTMRPGHCIGSTCTYRVVTDSTIRGNQRKHEITVKDLANDNCESGLQRSLCTPRAVS